MKYLLLAGSLLLARATAAAPAPTDTIPGQALLLRRLSAAMCAQLTAEHRTTDFSKLDAPVVSKVLSNVTYQALMKYADGFEELQRRSADSEQMGMWLVQEAHIQLLEQCPLARPLVAVLGMQALGLTAGVSVAERTALRPVVLDVCRRLNADNARQPFVAVVQEMRAGAVLAAMQAATEAAIAAHPAVLAQLYGTDAAPTSEQQVQARLKIGQLCMEECPAYMVLLQRSTLVEPPPAPPALLEDAPPLLLDSPPPPPPSAKQRRKK
jgi:hypothetical protein